MRVLTKKTWLALIYSVAAGCLAFFSFIGIEPLLPSNIAWLNQGDPATFYLGWNFFRHTPWSLPIGLNPQYGLDLGSSILFSDSLPLLAFLFKPFASLLPEPFQYFGIWLLICFVMQAWFSYMHVSLISKNELIKILGASCFVCAPVLIWRMQGHYSLSGHFLILAALYLSLMPSLKRPILYWALLLTIGALVHPYILVMLMSLWGANLVDRFIRARLSLSLLPSLFIETLLILALVLLTCWQIGYFSIGPGIISQGYGDYRMNVLSIIDPQGFSYVLGNIPKNGNGFEGFNYLGLGIIFLACAVLLYGLLTNPTKLFGLVFRVIAKWPVLFIACLCLTVFAITHIVSIGSYEYLVDLPTVVINATNLFRASGRMFWPVYYLLILASLYLALRLFNARVIIILLGIALLIQYVDGSKVWLRLRAQYSVPASASWPSPMTNEFWGAASSMYRQVRVLMPGNSEPHWQEIASYASVHHLPTDAVYLGRIGSLALQGAVQNAKTAMITGRYDPNTLYFIVGSALSIEGRRPLLYANAQKDLVAHIDGFTILAPNWKSSANYTPVNLEIKADDPLMPFDQRILFGHDYFQTQLYLGDGWSRPEVPGVWSEGGSSTLTIPVKNGQIRQLLVEAFPMIHPLHTVQTFDVKVNGVTVKTVTLSGESNGRFTIDIPENLAAQLPNGRQLLSLQFDFLNPVSPRKLGLGEDVRMLGFQLRAMTIIAK